MRRRSPRAFVLGIFFVFIFLHQTDRLLISPLTTDIMAEFALSKAQMGLVSSAALLVGGVLFLVWGYLYDRYARAPLLALASFLWGATTWLSARAPTYPTFLATRAATGIDDSSYPGLYSLVADYFVPAVRGRVYGLLQLAEPLGYLAATVLAVTLGASIGWRNLFLLTGSAGILLSAVILFGVREPPRGQSEPELQGIEQTGQYRFDRRQAVALLRKRSLLLLFVQGFVGIFPWNVITFWFFAYLELERGYDDADPVDHGPGDPGAVARLLCRRVVGRPGVPEHASRSAARLHWRRPPRGGLPDTDDERPRNHARALPGAVAGDGAIRAVRRAERYLVGLRHHPAGGT
jgi:MFS family permease